MYHLCRYKRIPDAIMTTTIQYHKKKFFFVHILIQNIASLFIIEIFQKKNQILPN